MSLSQNLVLKLKQEQRLSQKLIQKLELIPMNNAELEEMIENEMMVNEFLEGDVKEDRVSDNSEEYDDAYDSDREVIYSQNDWGDIRKKGGTKNISSGPRLNFLENIPQYENDFRQHIRDEIALLGLTPEQEKVAEFILELLDVKGFLPYDLDTLTDLMITSGENRDEKQAELDHILGLIRNIQPYGISCFGLSDYFRLLYSKGDYNDPVLFSVIDEYLDEISNNRLGFVAARLDVGVDEIKKRIDFIRENWRPYPAYGFVCEDIDYIKPDATITEDGDIIMHSRFRRLDIRRREILESRLKKYKDRKSRNFLKRQYEKAREMVNNYNSRNSLFEDILINIYKRQKSFFSGGTLNPFRQTDLAEKLGVNVSTISRAVNGKYIRTPRGMMEASEFFVNVSTGDISSDEAMTRIKEIVEDEDKKRPLSDDRIMKILEENFNISIKRRTVAKYREKMNIPSSRQRKEF